MRTNVSLWWILTGFFALVAIAYTVWSVIWYGNLEWVGTVALFFTALMGALIGIPRSHAMACTPMAIVAAFTIA